MMSFTSLFILTLAAVLFHNVEGVCDPVTEFTCIYQNACIPIAKERNGVNDCFDNSDEVTSSCSKGGQFLCTSGTCIPISYKDDGDRDCADGADEQKLIGSDCDHIPNGCCPCNMYVSNSFCDAGKCKCSDGHYPSTLLNDCIIRTLGDPCTKVVDCSAAVQFSTCDNKRECSCALGYYPDFNETFCTARVIGDNCTADNECYAVMEGSLCVAGKCECGPDWFNRLDGSGCYHRNIGDACDKDSNCLAGINNAFCDTNNVCACVAGWLQKENTMDTCRRMILGSDACPSSGQCAPGIPNSECVSGKCQCVETYYENLDKTACVLRKIYDACTLNQQCGGVPNTMCSSAQVCLCLSGFLPTVSKVNCNPLRVGDSCNTTAQCRVGLPNSQCLNNMCECVTGFITDTDKTCRVRYLGIDSCSSETDCSGGIRNSNCTDGTCACNANYRTATNSMSTCSIISISSTSCLTNANCSRFPDSICKAGKCACPDGYRDETVKCTKLYFGGPCTAEAQCTAVVQNSTCNGTTCVCADPSHLYIESTTSCRRRVLGVDSCTMDSECRGGIANSLCGANKTCLCGPGYETTDDRLACLSTGASTETECTDFASCKPWAVALIIVLLLTPPAITGVVMVTYKNIQDRKKRLAKKGPSKKRTDPYRELGMAIIPTITSIPPKDTALHNLPEIGADWSITNDDTYFTSTPKAAVGLVMREKSFYRDITSITSKPGSLEDGFVLSKVDI